MKLAIQKFNPASQEQSPPQLLNLWIVVAGDALLITAPLWFPVWVLVLVIGFSTLLHIHYVSNGIKLIYAGPVWFTVYDILTDVAMLAMLVVFCPLSLAALYAVRCILNKWTTIQVRHEIL